MKVFLPILLFLLLCCAPPISNDNLYDPECSDGDYRCNPSLVTGTDTVYAGYPYKLNCENQGKDNYSLFRISSKHSLLSTRTTSVVEQDAGYGTVVFTEMGVCTLVVRAVRLNGNEDTLLLPLTVVSPYRIEVDSASLRQADILKFLVINDLEGVATDTSIRVQWYSRSSDKNHDRELPFGNPYFFSLDGLPDSVVVHAVLSDNYGLHIPVDTIGVPVVVRMEPYVTITRKSIIVPINSVARIPVNGQRFAENLVWESLANDTVITTDSGFLEYVWEDSLYDTLIVTARNKFGTLGNSDTVKIDPRNYRYNLTVDFPTYVYAYEYDTWNVEVTENNVVSADSALTFNWNVSPSSKWFDPQRNKLSLKFDSTVETATVKVFAYNGADSSCPHEEPVTVRRHPPELFVTVEENDVATDDDVVFFISAIDTISREGEVESVYYQLHDDSAPVPLDATDTLVLSFKDAGRQYIRFWCEDNVGFLSETITDTVYVRSLLPYFIDREIDMFSYEDDSITIAAPATTDRENDSIVKWQWYADSDVQPFKETTVNHIDTVFTEGDTVKIRVRCISALGDKSQKTASINVRVSKGLPSVDLAGFPEPEPRYINDSVSFRIAAHDSNGTVSMLHVLIDDDTSRTLAVKSSQQSVDTIMNIAMPSEAGEFTLVVVAVDNLNNVSAEYTLDDSLRVEQGRPEVVGVTPDTCWINDKVTCTLHVTDENSEGRPLHYVRFGTSGTFDSLGTDSTFTHSFATAGFTVVESYVIDDDNVVSDTLRDSVFAERGVPSVTAIATDSSADKIYVNDPITFSLSVVDPNDSSIDVKVSWDGDDEFEIAQKMETGVANVTHAFPVEDTGSVPVLFRVEDQDGMSFDTTFTVELRPGAPVIDEIAVDTCDGCLFVGDTVTYLVTAHDDNGTLKKVVVDWGDNTGTDTVTIEDPVSGGVSEFRHAYHPSYGGEQSVVARVIDEDGVMSSAVTRAFAVRYGTPVVTKVNVDTFWVNDENEVEIQAADTNGNVIRRIVDWDTDGEWDDTVTGIASTSFTHAWDTSAGGETVVYRVQVMDDDSLTSEKICNAFIRLGRPVVFGADFGDTIQWVAGADDALDTMFYTWKVGDSYVMIDTADSNGQVTDFEWDRPIGGLIDYTTAIQKYKGYFVVNAVDSMAVRGRDDDSIWSDWMSFYVFPDGPPPTTTTTTTSQPGMPDVQVAWYGLDVKDDSLTQFAIAIDVASDGTYADTVLNFTEAKDGSIGKSGVWLTYTFDPQGFGIGGDFFYKVIARDARGSLPASISPEPVMYPYP